MTGSLIRPFWIKINDLCIGNSFLYKTKLTILLLDFRGQNYQKSSTKYFRNVIINLNYDDFCPQNDPFKVKIEDYYRKVNF